MKTEIKPQHTPTPENIKRSTPLPWQVMNYDGDKGWRIESTDGEMVAITDDWTWSKTNADLIVKAVNCHEEMLQACKIALLVWGKLDGSGQVGIEDKVGTRLVKAIAKAEGR